MTAPRKPRMNAVVRSELAALAAWVPMLVAMAIWHPHWPGVWYSDDPRVPGWFDVFILAFAADTLISKGVLMGARTWSWQRLGASLIALNLAFGFVYYVSTSFAFWPALAGEWWIRLGLRVLIVVFALWAKVELILTHDQPISDGYADLVRENDGLRTENAVLRAALGDMGVVVS